MTWLVIGLAAAVAAVLVMWVVLSQLVLRRRRRMDAEVRLATWELDQLTRRACTELFAEARRQLRG
jgi:flagellar biosynthesis/type III secretory pathway M-ring protein FliF/YscJ